MTEKKAMELNDLLHKFRTTDKPFDAKYEIADWIDNYIKEINGSAPFHIHQDHHIEFDFWDKIKILFGRKVICFGRLEVDKQVVILKGTGETIVEPFIKSKGVAMSAVDGCSPK